MNLKKNKYTFSIIIPTINRRIEAQQLLESICKLNYEKISEIIIVDQNKENFLEEIVNKFKKIVPIVHKRVEFKGAAKARNYGAEYANGDILVFPDDDSTILENTLTIVNDMFNEYFNIVAVFGKVSDYNEKVDIINYLNSYMDYDRFDDTNQNYIITFLDDSEYIDNVEITILTNDTSKIKLDSNIEKE